VRHLRRPLPADALRAGDGPTRVDLDRCIGCGLCVSTCSTGALSLRPRQHASVPPKGLAGLYRGITVDRFGVLGTARILGRVLPGRQV